MATKALDPVAACSDKRSNLQAMPPKSGAAAGGKATVAASAKTKKKASISDADARNLQKTFADYDVDGSGEISLLELQQFFDKTSPDL